MTRKSFIRGSAMALILLTGCSVGPEYETPDVSIPWRWANEKNETTSSIPVSETSASVVRERLAAWWTRMGDPLLDDLVRQAVEGNLDVASAKARVREARAARDKAVGGLWPSGGGSGSVSQAKSGTASAATSFSLGLDASWELDLFGGNRRAVEGAERSTEAAEWELRATLLTLIGDVVQSYVDAREAQARLALSRDTSVAQGRTADLTRTLVQAGSATTVDLRKAEAEAISADADGLSHETDFAQAAHRLAVLLGKAPGALTVTLTEPRPIPQPIASLPAGIPATVLSVHPTIQQAERELAKATAAIGAAEAERYPSVSLTGSLSTSAVRAGDLFSTSSISWAIGPSISLPLFNQGELAAAVTEAEAQRDQALIAYRQAVLTALEDVENALVALSRETSRLVSLRAVAAAYRESASLSRELYQAGAASFLEVLDAERSLYSSEDAVLQSQAAIAADHIALAKALGGGWDGAVDSSTPEVVDEESGPRFAFPM
ncbi:MAG: efflux transporter outer membrane subunit [Rhodospirillum sp.]|nr:efflux transporter outer membrane subunit [Rhodospirillum sp.]MCF8490933.1 efflux transporter outer membrane subunit [Rhodospirillum sp.]MCF8499064.1 efflux transporter outer membrane subunit [Rhodospirillum sp.]